jgi:transcriptional regulator with XRE-family HTH domain
MSTATADVPPAFGAKRPPDDGSMDRSVLGKRLAELRAAAGLTQKAVAAFLNVSQPNYARWETGKMLLPALHIPELAGLFGQPVEAFFADPGTPVRPPKSPPAPPRRKA